MELCKGGTGRLASTITGNVQTVTNVPLAGDVEGICMLTRLLAQVHFPFSA